MFKILKYISLILCTILILTSCVKIQEDNSLTTIENAIQDDEWATSLKSSVEFQLIYEDSKSAIYLLGSTGEIAVENKETNYRWYSNPQDRMSDSIASGDYASILNSQFIISFADESDKIKTYFSSDNCTDILQQHYKKLINGFSTTYLLGKRTSEILAPLILEKSKMERIVAQLNPEDTETLKNIYTFMDLSTVTDQYIKQQIIEKYPILENESMFIISNVTSEVSDYVREMIKTVLEKTDYTLEEMKADNKKYGLDKITNAEPPVNLTIEYTIKDGELFVNIPKSEIKYDSSKYIITDLDLLPLFGGTTKSDTGYNFIPDGSGAIINHNSNKTDLAVYNKQVYGRDRSIVLNEIDPVVEQVYLPVFGVKTEKNAFLATIEKGDGLAYIKTSIQGKNDSYNKVYSSFRLTPYSTQIFTSLNVFKMNNYQRWLSDTDIQIGYHFLSGEDANYSGMAREYRKYLQETKGIEKLNNNSNSSFTLSLIGAIKYKSTILGIPSDIIGEMTTYSQAKEITEKLKELDISRINLVYNGFANGGVYNDPFSKVSLISKLGGQKDFNKLLTSISSNSFTLSPTIDLLYSYNLGIRKKDIAKTIANNIGENYYYKLSNNARSYSKKVSYIISPVEYINYFESANIDYKKLNNNAISLLTLGNELNSDFNKNNKSDRQNTIKQVETVIKNAANEYQVTIEGGNAYALKGTSNIINFPVKSSRNYIFDESVPFYQIAIHGLISYSGYPLNYSSNLQESILEIIETGATPHFEWIYADNSAVKLTEYDTFSVNFKPWLLTASEIDKKTKILIDKTSGVFIVDHKKLSEGIFETSYENGINVFVNYTNENVIIDNKVIKAQDYLIEGGN